MRNILKILRWPKAGQQSPLPGEAMVSNDAGGYCYALDQWERLDRFLVLGTEGGTYYASERKLTTDAAQSVMDCIAEDGSRAVARIVEMSLSGRAPKQDPVLFALALATASAVPATRALALAAISRVARTASASPATSPACAVGAAACAGRSRGGTSSSRSRSSSCRP
jgi:60 kDa SS-A/Ro ribonucleoprotein